MKIYPYIFSLLTCIGIALPGYAQVDRNETLIRSALHGLEYEIKAGFSIGGTAPLPLPVEIRSIDGYNPTLAISIGGEVTKWIAVQNKLGIIVGLRLENKAMTTEATVKNYNMEILGQGGEKNQRSMDRRSKNQSTYCRTDNTSDGYLQTNQPVEYQSRTLFLLSTFKRIFRSRIRRIFAGR